LRQDTGKGGKVLNTGCNLNGGELVAAFCEQYQQLAVREQQRQREQRQREQRQRRVPRLLFYAG